MMSIVNVLLGILIYWACMNNHAVIYCHRKNDITGLLEHTFCANYDRFGQLMTHELIPGGQEITVTQDNKKEYVHHYVQWYFKRGIDHQLQAVQNGFNELIPRHLLSDFDEKELEVSSHSHILLT